MITLEQVEYIITELALKHNLVNSAFAGPSIYSLNADEIKEYPFIYVSPTGTHTLKENTTRFTFTIFAVDRLFEDSSNEDNIGSVSVETIRNLHLQLKKLEFITDIQDEIDVRLFTETEKMSDRCAGAYATIWLEVLNSTTCGSFFDEFDDYLGDYFNDYEIHNVLDNLASKEWVNRLLASVSVSGITPEEFERIMGDYVLRRNFATINGSNITNRQAFNLVEQSAYTQDIQNIYQAISGATPEDYSAMQEQVSANTSDIAALQETDSHIYILNDSSTQADIDAAVDAALNSGDTEFAKIVLYYLDRNQYIPLKPYYKYRPWADYDVYYTGCFPKDNGNMRMVLLGLTRGSMEVGYREQDFNFGLLVSRSQLPTINGRDLYRGGSFSLVENTNGGVTGIWSGTQADYDAIEEKNPTVLYVIK